MNEPIRAVLFDAVGTVIRPVPDVQSVYAAAGRRFGSRYDATSIHVRFRAAFQHHADDGATDDQHERNRWRNIVSDVFDDVTRDVESLFRELWDHFADPRHWALYDDVVPAWQALRERNMIIGIASNFDERLDAICRDIEPLRDADHVFCSSQIGFPKPRREFFAHCAAELDIPPNQILLVGDSLVNDVHAARAAGWQAALVQRNGPADESSVSQLTQITRLKFSA